jgi:solute carrier family 25 (mitochondrial phosphate transporter), member 3
MAKFVVYERVSELVYKQIDKSQISSTTNTLINLGSGLMAGFAAAIVSQPADTMLSKINKTKGLPGEGTMTRLVKIGKELGLRGSYAGIGARLFMVGTLTAGQFAIYGDIKKVSCFTTHYTKHTANVLHGLGRIRRCRNCEVEESGCGFGRVCRGGCC